jgi:hypothetical protein
VVPLPPWRQWGDTREANAATAAAAAHLAHRCYVGVLLLGRDVAAEHGAHGRAQLAGAVLREQQGARVGLPGWARGW